MQVPGTAHPPANLSSDEGVPLQSPCSTSPGIKKKSLPYGLQSGLSQVSSRRAVAALAGSTELVRAATKRGRSIRKQLQSKAL